MITTERLVLRPVTVADFESYLPMWVEQAMSGGLVSPLPIQNAEQVWARVLRWIGHWHMFGFGPFVAIERATGELCGEVGFGYFRRGHGADFDNEPEAMWKIANAFQGRGLAREAMEASLDWFDGRPESRRTVCMIDPDNVPSVALAEKLDFAPFTRSDYHGKELVLFERLRPSQ
jgi:RimJ/RimL family protein N-acetyltransferase